MRITPQVPIYFGGVDAMQCMEMVVILSMYTQYRSVRKGYTQMNNINLLGNLTKNPDVRYTKTGRAVATFTLACTNTYIDSATDETKEQTAFINCVAWGS